MMIEGWEKVLKKAWSIRLMGVGAILNGVESFLPLFSDSFPRGIFSMISFFFVAGAFIARIYAQKDFRAD